MFIIALDIARSTGYAIFRCDDEYRCGVLVEWGRLQPKTRGTNPLENRSLYDQIIDIMTIHRVDKVIYEKTSDVRFRKTSRKSNNTMMERVVTVRNRLAEVVGDGNVYGVFPQTWKKSEKKHRTIARCNMVFEMEFDINNVGDDDIADAIMIGDWFMCRMRSNPLYPYLHKFATQ